MSCLGSHSVSRAFQSAHPRARQGARVDVEALPKDRHLAPSNLLVQDRGLTAVIDFGTCGVSDPACDLVLAWTFLDTGSRPGQCPDCRGAWPVHAVRQATDEDPQPPPDRACRAAGPRPHAAASSRRVEQRPAAAEATKLVRGGPRRLWAAHGPAVDGLWRNSGMGPSPEEGFGRRPPTADTRLPALPAASCGTCRVEAGIDHHDWPEVSRPPIGRLGAPRGGSVLGPPLAAGSGRSAAPATVVAGAVAPYRSGRRAGCASRGPARAARGASSRPEAVDQPQAEQQHHDCGVDRHVRWKAGACCGPPLLELLPQCPLGSQRRRQVRCQHDQVRRAAGRSDTGDPERRAAGCQGAQRPLRAATGPWSVCRSLSVTSLAGSGTVTVRFRAGRAGIVVHRSHGSIARRGTAPLRDPRMPLSRSAVAPARHVGADA